jgi:hypothetical protein
MIRRPGTFPLWLLAAGTLALAGCRTETGSEESSSWFNFSSRRGGGGGSGGRVQPTRPEDPPAPVEVPTPSKPTAASTPKKVAEPVAKSATEPRKKVPAKPDQTPTTEPTPLARTKPESIRVPAGADTGSPGKPRPPATSLRLKPPEAPQASGGSATPLTLDLPVVERTRPPSPTPLPLGAGEGAQPRTAGTGLPLDVPAAASERRPAVNSLRLPGFAEPPGEPASGASLNLPEIGEPRPMREASSPFRLSAGDGRPGTRTEANRLSVGSGNPPADLGDRATVRLPGFESDSLATRPTGPRSLGVDGLLPEPAKPSSGQSLTLPQPSEDRPRTEPDARASIALAAGADPASNQQPRASLGLSVATGEASPGERGAPLAWSTGKPAPRDPRSGQSSPTLPSSEAAALPRGTPERPLHPSTPAPWNATASIPLPFRLGAWLSDEETHRRWREGQQERAEADEKARQAEQARLRLALLRFLIPAEPPK